MYEELKPLKIDTDRVFFVSDTHFGHRKIMEFCNRPWKTIEEHDEALINRWNETVNENDLVFHLGDFAFATNSRWKELINRLNGKIYLILGNHDQIRYPGDKIMSLFEECATQMVLDIKGRYVYLNHFPFLCYAGSFRGPENVVYQLFGHTHSGPYSSGKDTDRLLNLFPYQYDVGVDNNNYSPVSWEQICRIINYRIQNGTNGLQDKSPKQHTIPDEEYRQ